MAWQRVRSYGRGCSGERMKFFITRFSRKRCELRVREAFDEKPAISLREDAGIQNGDQPAILRRANQAADALPKLDQRVGQRELVEWISASVADVIAARLCDWVGGRIERQPRDDHLRERVAGDV